MNFSKQPEYDSSFPSTNGERFLEQLFIWLSRATVLTNAGMIPQSVKADVPDGTEITAEVSVNTASMNSSARSCRTCLGKGGGFVALIKASPSSSPVLFSSTLLSRLVSS